MTRNKTYGKKKRLAKKGRQNNNLPSWIIMKTNGKVRSSPYSRRHWRTSKLDAS
ncbi:MAG: 50S ribosomal protein L39e [Promethearchaeota archaeon]